MAESQQFEKFTTAVERVRPLISYDRYETQQAWITFDPEDDDWGTKAHYSYVCTCGGGGSDHDSEWLAREAAKKHVCRHREGRPNVALQN